MPSLQKEYNDPGLVAYWPASLLSLVLCATILTFARVTDIYGGFYVCCSGILWLAIWTLVAGFAPNIATLDVCRAMQGLAVAAYTPSCLALFSSIYPTGRRRNIMIGVYGACAPLGFFSGIAVSAALPKDKWHFYFWLPSMLAAVSFVLLLLCTPREKRRVPKRNLKMDWVGTAAITSGLIMVVYSLSNSTNDGWTSPTVLAPLLVGTACLVVAIYIEGWWASSPLIPKVFFRPKSVKPFMLALLFFYGTFGVWLFTTTSFFETHYHATGLKLALWFLPMAVIGFAIAVFGGSIMHIVPMHYILLCAGAACVVAPLLLAIADISRGYWPFPFPSMICASLGVDVTFTVSVVYLSATQPQHLQGLVGAMVSILFNLAVAFALAFAQIIETGVTRRAEHAISHGFNGTGVKLEASTHELYPRAGGVSAASPRSGAAVEQGQRAAFWFACASAVVGLLLVAAFVRVPPQTSTTCYDEDQVTDAFGSRSVLGDEKEAKTPSTVSSSVREIDDDADEKRRKIFRGRERRADSIVGGSPGFEPWIGAHDAARERTPHTDHVPFQAVLIEPEPAMLRKLSSKYSTVHRHYDT